jgi:peptide/nickel transport system substrate-binding protein
MPFSRRSLLATPIALAATPALSRPAMAQSASGGAPPRRETLILENPEGVIRNAGWFNIWSINAGSQYNGLQQLAMDTLWYIDPESGVDGPFDNSLASEPPIYNADFSEMTARLRRGLHWSDGVEFTAADVVHTVETQVKNPGMRWSAQLILNVAEVSATDPYTVVFKLKKPNARFHANFMVRFNAIWIMPKHVFEKVADPVRYDFNPPVTLSAYKLHSFDPEGRRFTWERREDWQRTSLGRFGQPGPRYVAYVDGGPADKRVIAQLNHDLDVVHDVAPEGMFTLARQSEQVRGWFPKFPYAHPDPTLPAVIFNTQNPMFTDRRVRWALALLVDMKAVSMAGYRGAATISAIALPPTGTHPRDYHEPLQAWLSAFELDTGKQKIKPYDPTIGTQIAALVRPSNPNVPRAPAEIAQNWRQFGIDSRIDVAQGTSLADRRNAGDFETMIAWSVETYGGHPDLAYFLDSWHSQYVAPPGKAQPWRNWQRWASPEMDAIIERMRRTPFDDPSVVEIGRDYAKLMVQEMPIIPLMAYNVFTTMDTTYWTGFPTAENPYTNPVPNWGNSRYMFSRLKPRQA